MALLSLEQVREGLAEPSILPQNLDFARQAILLLQLSRDELRRASFLDDRIRNPQTSGRWVQFEQIEQLIGALAHVKPRVCSVCVSRSHCEHWLTLSI